MAMKNDHRIYKYELPIDRGVRLALPIGSQILHVGEQGGGLFVWASVNPEPDAWPDTWLFNVVGTGGKPPVVGRHLGTVQCSNGFVWHVFVTEPKAPGESD